MNPKQYFIGITFFLWPSLSMAQMANVDQSVALPSISTADAVRYKVKQTNQNEPLTVQEPHEKLRNTKIVSANIAYQRGRERAKEKKFAQASFHFEVALSYIRLPIILYATAQCQKDLGHEIEALLLFDEALKMTSEASDHYPLSRVHQAAAIEIMEELLKRFVEIEIIAPGGDSIKSIKIDDKEWSTIQFLSVCDKTWMNRDCTIGLSKEQLTKLEEAKGESLVSRTTLQTKFWIKPNAYNFEIQLKSGRLFFLKKHSVVTRKSRIDLTYKKWPSWVVIDEVPANTKVVIRNITRGTTPFDRQYNQREPSVEIADLNPGQYDLVATRKGFVDIKKNINIGVGHREKVYLGFKQKPFYKKWLFWVGVGLVSATITGVAVPLVRSNQPDPPGSGTVTFEDVTP